MTFLRLRRLLVAALAMSLVWLVWQERGSTLGLLQLDVVGIPLWALATAVITLLLFSKSQHLRLAVLLIPIGCVGLLMAKLYDLHQRITKNFPTKTLAIPEPSRH